MSNKKNFFVVNRSLFKNHLWKEKPFSKGQAWLDLFGKANHADGFFEKKGQRIDLKRGQTGRSIEKMGEEWGWSRNKVKRFLARLEDERMIERDMDHPMNHLTSIITICNYDKYQFLLSDDELPDEPSNELPDELPDEPQTIRKEERIEEEKKKLKALFEKAFEKWWLTSPKRNGRRIGKGDAKKQFMKIKQSEWNDLKTATTNYCKYLSETGLNAMDAKRFLNGKWKDYFEVVDSEKKKSDDDGSDSAKQRMLDTQKELYG